MDATRVTPHGRDESSRSRAGRLAWLAVASAIAVGLALMADAIRHASATYDEVAYLRIAARWWRTGDQEAITRMGSPLTFWKLQQAPVLWLVDRTGRGVWIDEPERHQADLLTWARAGSLWIWVAALLVTSVWAGRLHGPRAMALAAWLFSLSPNLLAHGSLVTMEMPLVAASAGMLMAFWSYLDAGRARDLWLSAALAGLAFSCKFTVVVFLPILALLAWERGLRRLGRRGLAPSPRGIGKGLAFVAILLATDLVVTGGATLPPSESRGSHPSLEARLPGPLRDAAGHVFECNWPRDWVAFAIQMRHQASGGPSYLLGERRERGWWYYYPVALAVKVPLSIGMLLLVRGIAGRRVDPEGKGGMLPRVIVLFLAVTCVGSSRNYGVRYLLPLAPLALVWVSGLAEGPRWARRWAVAGLVGQALAVASIHPYELSYFNAVAGGPAGGHLVLADSNLDWGQGARTLARLQARRPEFRDLTLYYFGDTDPGHYGVAGVAHVIDAGTVHPGLPERPEAAAAYLGVSASLHWGPWGPPGYFDELDGLRPVAWTDDATIAIYRASDLRARRGR